MGKKNDKKNKATESSKAARKALKEGLAKPAVEVSEYALEGEQPEWNAQLDALREADLAQGMNAKAMRVQRQQRIRLLKKGKELPAHGGLNDLQEPEVVEPVIASDTESDDEPTLFVTEETYSAPDPITGENNNPEGLKPSQMSKKQRKALAKQEAADAARREAELVAAQERGEADRKAAAKAAKKAAKNAPAVVEPDPLLNHNVAAEELNDVSGDVEPAKPTRRDNSLIALQEAQKLADETGKKQKVIMPRRYKSKNYGVKLIAQYTTKDPSLTLTYKGDDAFNEDTGDFSVTLIAQPKK